MIQRYTPVLILLLGAACTEETTYKTNTKLRGESVPVSEGSGDGKREAGNPCTGDEECASGACESIKGQMVCAARCSDAAACDAGLVCKKRDPRSSAAPLICVEKNEKSCLACTEDSQCGDSGNACVQSPDGKVCGVDCTAGGDAVCPSGTMCIALRDSQGNELSRQCIPNSGACKSVITPSCSGPSCNSVVGPTGTPGTPTGSTGPVTPVCVASTEVCDGIDNDCDGLTDEDASGVALQKSCGTGIGECVGVQVCTGGAYNACSAPAPTTETCNTKDDDCDGQTDEGLTASVDSCGSCGNVCPGASASGNSTRTCTASGASFVCGLTCKGNSYDIDNSPNNGCEAADEPNHSNGTSALPNLGTIDDNDDQPSVLGYDYFLADARPHDTAPTNRSTPQGKTNAEDWYKVEVIDRTTGDLEIAARLDVTFMPPGNLYEICVTSTDDDPASMQASCGARPGTKLAWRNGNCACAYGGNRISTTQQGDPLGYQDGSYYVRVRWISGSFVSPTSGSWYQWQICDDSFHQTCYVPAP